MDMYVYKWSIPPEDSPMMILLFVVDKCSTQRFRKANILIYCNLKM